MPDFTKIIFTKSMPEAFAIRSALKYLPQGVLDHLAEELTILTMTDKAATRLSRPLCETKEIIFISDRIFPRVGFLESESGFRFFVFVVMHEIAHAYLKHKCPVYDGIGRDAVNKQEREADLLARDWYNEYVAAHPEIEIPQITCEEMTAFRIDLEL